jgi:hypothetical protein
MSTLTQPLKLAGLEPFGRGRNRDCFVHPDHPDRCVKVLREERAPEIRHRQLPLWRRWRKSVHDFDESFRDYCTLKILESDNDPSIWRHLPRCFGWVETDRGRGLVIELIRDADGLISRSFLDYLWMHSYDDRAQAAVDELAQFWEVSVIPTRSLGLHNIAAQWRPDGTLRLVVIDGFGSTAFIPLPRWSKTIETKRMRRQILALRQDILATLTRKSRGEGRGEEGFLLSRG